MSLVAISIVFGAFPFALIQVMPGKKSFTLLSIIYVSLIAYGWYDLMHPSMNGHWDGPGSIIAIGMFFLLCCSAAAGILTKAITLLMAWKRVSQGKRNLARLTGIMLIPCFIYAPDLYYKWNQRLPSTECKYDLVTFSISGELFIAPSLGIIFANTGNGKNDANGMEKFFGFHGPKDFRRFCSTFNNGQTPAEVNALSISFNNIGRAKNDPRFIPQCTAAKWPNEICTYAGYSTPDGYPQELAIYDREKFNPGYVGGGWDYQQITTEMLNANMPSDIPDFKFNGYEYFWTDKESDESSSLPLSLKCHKSNKALYCRIDEKLQSNINITYAGLISLENPIPAARSLRDNTHIFLQQLRKTP